MNTPQTIAELAFEKAILNGRLSEDPADNHYAGRYMYMGNTKYDFDYDYSKDLFKNINTRKYDV